MDSSGTTVYGIPWIRFGQLRRTRTMLCVGDIFPEFALNACISDGGRARIALLQSSTLVGRWGIYFFWPRDFTPVCATELQSFIALAGLFTERNAAVVGGSGDSVFAHMAWLRELSLEGAVPFPLLADVRYELAQALGIFDAENAKTRRATVIVDPGGVVRHVSVNDVAVGRSPREALRILDALQTNELCPSNWELGQVTLGNASPDGSSEK